MIFIIFAVSIVLTIKKPTTMNEETMTPQTTGMIVNIGMKADLISASKWALFLCIVGSIGMALLVIVGILMFVVGSNFGLANTPLGAGIGALYLVIAAIYIYPLIKGFQFANATKAACLTDNETQLARGFSGLRAVLQFFGIMTIIVLVIYAFALVGAFFIASMAR